VPSDLRRTDSALSHLDTDRQQSRLLRGLLTWPASAGSAGRGTLKVWAENRSTRQIVTGVMGPGDHAQCRSRHHDPDCPLCDKARREFAVGGVPGLLAGVEVQQLLPRRRGERWPRAHIRGWPTPISTKARTQVPPAPYHPVYGPAARDKPLRHYSAYRVTGNRPRPYPLTAVSSGSGPSSSSSCRARACGWCGGL
jgi:hypothetical protein